MNGGTLTAGATIYSNVYGFNGSASIVATSDASGNPATISAEASIEPALPVTVNRGAATPAVDLLISAKLVDGSSASGLAVSGNGILRLTGSNTFTGASTITGATVQANSAATALGASTATTTITSSGVLAGTGSTGSGTIIVGTATSGAGGTITGGTGATPSDTIGTLTSTGNEAWNASGTYAAKINALTSDELVLSGLSASSSFTIQVTGTTGSTFTVGKMYVIADATSSTSAFTGINFNLTTAGSAIGDTFMISTPGDGASGQDLDLTVTATPEPGTLSLLSIAAGGLLLSRRRRLSSESSRN
jgi:hypothetical protein